MKSIESAVSYLNGYLNTYLDDVPRKSKLNKHFTYLKSIDFTKKQNMKKLDKAINHSFRPTTLTPDTIGSFLFGCRQNTYGDVSKECSPLCINSLPSDTQQMYCENEVYELNPYNHASSDNRLKLIHQNDSYKGSVFVENHFDGFNNEEINTLRRQGVGSVDLYNTDNSRHWCIGQDLSLNQLPKLAKTPRRSLSLRSIGSEIFEENGHSYLSFIILFIIIIVVVATWYKYKK